MIDKQLIQSCINNDRKAHNRLYELCFANMIKLCWRYTKSKEEAIRYFQDGFIKIVLNLEKYKYDQNFEAWASRVMINTIIDEVRKQNLYKDRNKNYDDFPIGNIPEADFYYEKESSAEVMCTLQQLPDGTREIFNLFFMEDYTHKEIAAALGITESASKWHVAKAKQILKEVLISKRMAI